MFTALSNVSYWAALAPTILAMADPLWTDGAAAGAKTRGGGTECIYTGQVAGARTRPLALIGPLRTNADIQPRRRQRGGLCLGNMPSVEKYFRCQEDSAAAGGLTLRSLHCDCNQSLIKP
ncbi:hypothetical protein EYF80_011055 [Liparis tanakae]|uniref:Secreted protein n=1 Tax=Liparis tanakae TaxID=230148 RepID=A0A4Z2ILI2_9TELE|nr:hypothetical protein EYF80_011055 [Liparis tanakae]